MAGGVAGGPSAADVRALADVLGDPFRPRRRPTRVVRVGDVGIGGDEPIRIQSMTNTDTMDTAATVEQITRLAEAGCEIVRVTAPSIRDAENLREIKRRLAERGVTVPIVADIHFTPNAAMIAAGLVEKVRINPGNYADKKKFEVREYDDAQYAAEIERVAERFRPLVRRCRENGVAMRIGTNHGSLSDRILNRFGDTPEGMVESALEFLDVCEDEAYHDVVFSMKASNTQVAIQAYRLLAARLERRRPGAPSYPFHVGVTEAGDAEDGRIKSAIGIGALLEDGLGDTIRVSLTEDPVREVPVARAIVRRAEQVLRARPAAPEARPIAIAGRDSVAKPVAIAGRDSEARSAALQARALADPFRHARRATAPASWDGLAVGGEAPVRVELALPDEAASELDPDTLAARLVTGLVGLRDVACESLLVPLRGAADLPWLTAFAEARASLGADWPISLALPADDAALWTQAAALVAEAGLAGRLVVRVGEKTEDERLAAIDEAIRSAGRPVEWQLEATGPALASRVGRLAQRTGPASIGLRPGATLHDHRRLAAALEQSGGRDWPIVLHQAVGREPESTLIDASVRLGGLLCDGIGDAVSMHVSGVEQAASAVDLAYRVLQGARQRTTRTEYISCPSCGRTLFDLEETTARIKAKTAHLSGVKIAVMGCIVNGPGEMADADFGYVGSGVGQVTLYVGHRVVARAVPEAEAPDRLVSLIREHGQWREAPGAADPEGGAA